MNPPDDAQPVIREKPRSLANVWGPLASIGTVMAVSMAIFGYLGYRLDKWSDTYPYWLIMGLFAGLLVGFYDTWKWVRHLDPGAIGRPAPPPAPKDPE
ncbi:MAG: hypothetical protein A2498_06630 [Lentisphaerae bacterium RIFOXYC12_FULL_60_16]|nr:MAG: hypothetical protein A2498_06630 [Lentisphaerae bacterium RIFOXYC12_FULL_60_16]OGV84831.1 MAG: hypothetical protein A2340_06590 [Lentisphaerae bacterium RIFOXYB12_FULL_60_10]